MKRSSVKSKWDYRSMLVGNTGYIPLSPTMFFPGEGYSTAINKMPYSTEAFSTSSSTLSSSVFVYSTSFQDGSNFGYVLASGNQSNKVQLPTDSVAALSNPYTAGSASTYGAGITPSSAWYLGNTVGGGGMSTSILYNFSFATDTATYSSPLTTSTNIGPYSGYTMSNNPFVYFGGGTPPANAAYGGLVKYNTSTAAVTSVWADATATSRTATSSAANGTVGAYLGGGWMMPYQTIPTNILKITFATDTSYSTLSATLSAGRNPARVGVQAGVCAYYAGGKSTGGSGAVSLTTVEKLTYSTETRSMVSTASVNRDGVASWNTI